MVALPWRHTPFRRVIAYLALSTAAYAMGVTFLFPFCFNSTAEGGLGWGVALTTGCLIVLPQLLNAWTAPAWGRAIDRFGPKSAWRAGALAGLLPPLAWLLTHGHHPWAVSWLPLSMVLVGLTQPGVDQALLYLQLREFPIERRTAYTASYQVVFGLATVTGAVLGGVAARFGAAGLAQVADAPAWLSHYHLVFAASFGLRLLAFRGWFGSLPLAGRAGGWLVYRSVARDLLGLVERR